MVSTEQYLIPCCSSLPNLRFSQNKNTVARVGRAPDRSLSFAGILVLACVSSPLSFVRLAQRPRTSAKHASSISNIICQLKFVTLHWPSRVKRQVVISIESTMRKTLKLKYVYVQAWFWPSLTRVWFQDGREPVSGGFRAIFLGWKGDAEAIGAN